MKSEEGRKLIYKLVEESDVLVHNFRKGVMEKLGFSLEEMIKINPQIIYVSMTTYGTTGKMKKHVGHDFNFASTSGYLRSIYHRETKELVMPGVFVVSILACSWVNSLLAK